MPENFYYVKMIEQHNERLVAVCDKEIIGVPLMSSKVKIRASHKFYGEELMTGTKVLKELKNCTSANVIGVNIISLLLEHRFISKEAILWLENPNDKSQKVGHAIIIF